MYNTINVSVVDLHHVLVLVSFHDLVGHPSVEALCVTVVSWHLTAACVEDVRVIKPSTARMLPYPL